MTTNEVQQISTFRRVFPQVCERSKKKTEKTNKQVHQTTQIKPYPTQKVLATLAKNLIIFNLGEFIAFPSIVLPSLAGLNAELNPDETVHATGAEISWLCEFLVDFP